LHPFHFNGGTRLPHSGLRSHWGQPHAAPALENGAANIRVPVTTS
jgi:hypothetical protein